MLITLGGKKGEKILKKILSVFVAIALCACMCACGGPTVHINEGLFERVASYNDCDVYRHVHTNVMYVYFGSSGSFSVMFNADGSPMVWNGR